MNCPKCKVELKDMKCQKCGVKYKVKGANSSTNSDGGKSSSRVKTKKKKSIWLLISAILGSLYFIYGITYFSNLIRDSGDGFEMLGSAMALDMVMPHFLMVFLGALFNWLSWAMSNKALALTGAIMYCVSIAMFPMYTMYVIAHVILSFIGFVRMKK